MVHCHFEDGQLVQSAWHCIAGRDHLGQFSHVAVHTFSPTLLHFTVLVAPERARGEREREREGGGGGDY